MAVDHEDALLEDSPEDKLLEDEDDDEMNGDGEAGELQQYFRFLMKISCGQWGK